MRSVPTRGRTPAVVRIGACALIALAALAGPRGSAAAPLDSYGEMQGQLTAGKYAQVDQDATTFLQTTKEGPLVSRVLVVRAQARLKLNRPTEAIEDFLGALDAADTSQRKATIYLELSRAATQLSMGDHACAAIRQAVDVAGDDEMAPIGKLALEASRKNNCPSFDAAAFQRLFTRPFAITRTTGGTVLGALFGNEAYARYPADWAIDENSRNIPDSLVLGSLRRDAFCAVHREDGALPIKAYVEAIAKENGTRGSVLNYTDGREARMGWARAVQVDFEIGPLPGRITIASPSDRTYSVMCFALNRDALPKMRRAADTIATSMRWAPVAAATASTSGMADDLDARRVVADARTAFPAIGLLTGGGSRCTAFLAGSDRVLVTAAHCVLNQEGKPKAEQFEFQPGYTNGRALGVHRATLMTSGEFKTPSDSKGLKESVPNDWAVLSLDRPAGVAPLALVRDLPSSALNDQSLNALGYSTDIENGRFLAEDNCKVTAVDAMRIEHSCRGAPGASGGPIFLVGPDGTRGAVVGVNVQESASRTSERVVIRNLRGLAGLRTLPDVDFGGRAVYAGAFANAVKLLGGGAFASSR